MNEPAEAASVPKFEPPAEVTAPLQVPVAAIPLKAKKRETLILWGGLGLAIVICAVWLSVAGFFVVRTPAAFEPSKPRITLSLGDIPFDLTDQKLGAGSNTTMQLLNEIDANQKGRIQPANISPSRLKELEQEVANGQFTAPEISHQSMELRIESSTKHFSNQYSEALPYFRGHDPIIEGILLRERIRAIDRVQEDVLWDVQ